MKPWTLDNLHVWELPTWDLVERSPEERAQLLVRFGVQHYAYLGTASPFGKPDINTSQLDADAEIRAMRQHGINVRAWYFWLNSENPAREPQIVTTLQVFQRHGIQPQIWVPQSFAPSLNQLDPISQEGFPSTAAEQQRRVEREAERIAAFVRLAAPYHCKVNLYNHRGWYGIPKNQLAIIDRLRELGIHDVGMVYNLGHSFSAEHDDAPTFAQMWREMQPHVVAINVMVFSYRELEMLRIIHESGWQGAVGTFAAFGNVELGIPNALWTINWIAERLKSATPSRACASLSSERGA